MLRNLRARFTEPLMARAAGAYGLDPEDLLELDGYENIVFDGEPAGRPLVLRIGHSGHRSADQVAAELAWVESLAGAGCQVAAPVPARDGRPLVTIPDVGGGEFVVAGFSKAPGVILDDDAIAKQRHWNADLFDQWGSVTAAIHLHGAVPTRRPLWHDIDELKRLGVHLAAAPADVRAAARAHVAALRRSVPEEGFGLIHADLTQWNFTVDERGRITVFDFDSSMRCWHAMDVAVALYYGRQSDEGDDEQAFVAEFLEAFVRGYRSVHSLPGSELARLPDLLVLQTVILYSLAQQAAAEDDSIAFLDYGARRLLGEEPVVEFGDTLERLIRFP